MFACVFVRNAAVPGYLIHFFVQTLSQILRDRNKETEGNKNRGVIQR